MMLLIFSVVFVLLWTVLSKTILKKYLAPTPPAPIEELPPGINELKVLKKELEDKLELYSNKKEAAELKEKIAAINAKLAEYA
jgi:NhaP-type Na+/H+ or K+/H+ antiporter